MLYLISKTMPLPEGVFTIRKLSTTEVAEMIVKANQEGLLESRIHHASSASALSKLTEIEIRTTSKEGNPYLTQHDTIVEIRVDKQSGRGPIVITDLEFLSIKCQPLPAWPAVVDD